MNGGLFALIAALIGSIFSMSSDSWGLGPSYSALGEKNLPGRIRICSQNLFRFGAPVSRSTWSKSLSQREHLVGRFRVANCDIIAVQEVFGAEETEAKKNLEILTNDLAVVTGRKFSALVGRNRSDQIRNGFIIAEDLGRTVEVLQLWGGNLPRLNLRGPSARFTRAPIGVVIELKATKSESVRLFIVNYHLKSKGGGHKDPQGLDFEPIRIEMAEAIREWVLREEIRLRKETVVIMLGDRNSDEFSATDEVLRGSKIVTDFQRGGSCRIRSELQSECDHPFDRAPNFMGLLERKNELLRQEEGTYRFRGALEILDEIFVEVGEIGRFSVAGHVPAVGTVGTFGDGSDHKLVWVEMRGVK